jgi:DNA-binding response OmpR family regulator
MAYDLTMPPILVVDDDVATLGGLVALLEGAGHAVVAASDFAEGRRLLLSARPSLLVVDIRLHEFNGLQLVVIAQSLSPSPPSIVTSGYDDPVLEREARSLGASFMLKPLDPARLLALVNERSRLRA